MSSQKGNIQKNRPQKHQNRTKFKNDLHDKSPAVKHMNSLIIANVCDRCKSILEWKIKYKKYKALKTPGKCVKCSERNVKHAYHIMCLGCSKSLKLCPKCDSTFEIEESDVQYSLESPSIQEKIKSLPERRRRTFFRLTEKLGNDKVLSSDIVEMLDKLCVSHSNDSEFSFSDDSNTFGED